MTNIEDKEPLTADQLRALQRTVEELLLIQVKNTIGTDSLLDSCAAYKAFKEGLTT